MKNLIIILLILPTLLMGQVWENTYGLGTGYSVEQTTDGGFIVIGYGYDSSRCTYMIKTDSYGDTLWTKHHRINKYELFGSGQQTMDGGYIITGPTRLDGPIYSDIFLLKTNSSGDTLWSKVYGWDKDDHAFYVQQTFDGGYIITGWSETNHYRSDAFLIKTDSTGDVIWQRKYGDDNHNTGRCVQQTSDGGYFITGYTFIGGSGFGWVNLIKTDSAGDELWTCTYNDIDEDFGMSGKQTTDGGYIVTGCTERTNNIPDILLMKIFADGETEWVKTYGTNDYSEIGNCVEQTTDGGFIIVGNKKTYANSYDVYLVKTDSYGEVLWTRTYGGPNGDGGLSVQQTEDEGYIITGVYQDDQDRRYVYLIKTDAEGLITFTSEIPVLNPNKKLIKIVDLSGREISKPNINQPYIEIFSDGTTEKETEDKIDQTNLINHINTSDYQYHR